MLGGKEHDLTVQRFDLTSLCNFSETVLKFVRCPQFAVKYNLSLIRTRSKGKFILLGVTFVLMDLVVVSLFGFNDVLMDLVVVSLFGLIMMNQILELNYPRMKYPTIIKEPPPRYQMAYGYICCY